MAAADVAAIADQLIAKVSQAFDSAYYTVNNGTVWMSSSTEAATVGQVTALGTQIQDWSTNGRSACDADPSKWSGWADLGQTYLNSASYYAGVASDASLSTALKSTAAVTWNTVQQGVQAAVQAALPAVGAGFGAVVGVALVLLILDASSKAKKAKAAL